jgi:hypothetical protein
MVRIRPEAKLNKLDLGIALERQIRRSLPI